MTNRSAAPARPRPHRLRPPTLVLFAACAVPSAAFADKHHWAAPVSGDWFDATRWTPAGVPDTAADDGYVNAFSPTATPYTVTLDSSLTMNSMTVDREYATLRLAPATDAPLVLDPRDLQISRGTLAVAGDVQIHAPVTNYGTITVAPDSTLAIIAPANPAPGSFPVYYTHRNAAQLNLGGPLRLERVGFFHEGGWIGGDAHVLLYDAPLIISGSASGAPGTFVFRTSGSIQSPNLPQRSDTYRAQTVIVQANDESPAGKDISIRTGTQFFNGGHLVLESTAPDTSITLEQGVSNTGTFTVNGGGGTRRIRSQFYNTLNATADFNASTEIIGSARNDGTLNTAPGATVTVRGSGADSFILQGTLNNLGEFHVSGIDFTHLSGAITGNPVLLTGSGKTLRFNDTSAARSGPYLVRDGRTIEGDIPKGVSVTAQRSPDATTGTNLVVGTDGGDNYGSLTLHGGDAAGHAVTLDTYPGSSTPRIFTNHGTLTTLGPTGAGPARVTLRGHLLNRAGANAEIKGNTDVTGWAINEARLVIAPDATLRVGTNPGEGSHTFTMNGGTLDVKGALRMSLPFIHYGGTISGNPIDLTGGRLVNKNANGSGSFLTRGPLFLAPAPAVPGTTAFAVNPGQTIIVRPDMPTGTQAATLNGDVGWINRGTVSVDGNATLTSLDAPGGRHIVNRNLIRFENNPTVPRTVDAKLTNDSTATLSVAARTTFNDVIDNRGSLNLTGDGALTVRGPTTNSGTITLRDDADMAVDAPISNTGSISVGFGSQLDLKRHSLHDRRATAAARDAALANYTAAIRYSRNSFEGLWRGAGITTSAATPLTGLAVAPVSDTDLLIRYTWNGDANVDGRINSDDYFRIDSGFLAQPENPRYHEGDFNYDRTINSDDYFLIDQAFLGQDAPLTATTLLTATAVPEPTLSLLIPAICLLSRRRRCQCSRAAC